MDDDPLDSPVDDLRPADPPPWDLDASPVGRVLTPTAPPPADGVDWAEFPLRAGALLIDLAAASVVTDLLGRAITWTWNRFVQPVFTDPSITGDNGSGRPCCCSSPSSWCGRWWAPRPSTCGTPIGLRRAQMALGLFTVDTEGRALRPGPAAIRFVVLGFGWMIAAAASAVVQVVVLFGGDTAGSRQVLAYAGALVLPVAWYLLLSLTMLRDPRGRGWQDKAAGSVVVRRSGPPS
jgi:hypothetical protein